MNVQRFLFSQKTQAVLVLSLTSFLTLVFSTSAFAQEAAAAAPKGPSTLEALLPFAAMIAIFYFLIIRPQSQRQKAQQKLLSDLKRGDDIITTGGILGRIEGMTELYVTLEIADGVRIKMLRSQIAGTQKAQQAQQGKA